MIHVNNKGYGNQEMNEQKGETENMLKISGKSENQTCYYQCDHRSNECWCFITPAGGEMGCQFGYLVLSLQHHLRD